MKVGFKWSNITVEERLPNVFFLDLAFVFKILMRNGSRFRIESMHLECGMPNNQDHGIGQKFQFWAVIKFLDLEIRVGVYSRWTLIRGWAIIKFSPFSASVVCLFCNKTINANNKKNEEVTKQGFCKIL